MREMDDEERRDAYEERRERTRNRCLCGYPDWPGRCPGPAYCPIQQCEGDDEPPFFECPECGKDIADSDQPHTCAVNPKADL